MASNEERGTWQVTLPGGPLEVPQTIRVLRNLVTNQIEADQIIPLIEALEKATYHGPDSFIGRIAGLAEVISGSKQASATKVTDSRKLDPDLISDANFETARPSAWLAEFRRLSQGNVLRAAHVDSTEFGPVFPSAPYAGDCGLDLAITKNVDLWPGQSANVPCGVAVALPPGTFGWIVGRSSTWSKHGLIVMPGIIDEGWRGELRVLVHRPYQPDTLLDDNHACLHIPAGTRLAQMIVLPNLMGQIKVEQVDTTDDLPRSDRGTNGFGSSG